MKQKQTLQEVLANFESGGWAYMVTCSVSGKDENLTLEEVRLLHLEIDEVIESEVVPGRWVVSEIGACVVALTATPVFFEMENMGTLDDIDITVSKNFEDVYPVFLELQKTILEPWKGKPA